MKTVNFSHLPLRSGDIVLDLGCGEGRHVISAYVEANVHSIGVDLSLDDLKTTRERFASFAEPNNEAKSFGLSSASALDLPFADNTFDKIICSEVLEHIQDYRGALREIERVLKPGGLFCASVPRRWPEKICWALSEGYYRVPGGHLRIFRSSELRREIEYLGFKYYYRHWAHALHVPFWWLKCLFWQSRDTNWLVRQYHRLLVWDLMKNPALTRILEKSMNPIMGKSVVMYFRQGGGIMSGLYLSRGLFPEEFLRPTVQFILDCQRDSGEIPWFEGGYTDPWDHVESAMGLSIGGELNAARKAYEWLAGLQLADGSWWASYRGQEVDNANRRESNFVAYIATGVWHHYLISADRHFLHTMWPTVDKAIGFVLSLQSEHGEIDWAVDGSGKPLGDALVTGCSSIYKSLECAHNIAVTLGEDRAQWLTARDRLGKALRQKPERFDRTWESKSRYSMDWFYPVLAGVYTGAGARMRLASRWNEFVEDKLGCRCEKQQPWVTVAETCELVMALLAAGDHARAVEVYSWLQQWRTSDGSYWTGYQLVEDLLWPDEKPTWTAGAILLAADALTKHTAASGIFCSVQLLDERGAARERLILVD